MNPQLVINVLLIVGVLVLVGYRQSTWRAVVPERMWRAPIVVGVVGLVLLAPSAASMTSVDIAAIVVELVIALGTGAWMGAIARFRRSDPTGAARGRGPTGEYESRTGWWGMALWILVLALRVGVDLLAAGFGAHSLVSAGMILLLVSVNRAARAAVLSSRLARLAAEPGGGSARLGVPRV
ncbi:hypothetical protein J2Y69_000765 [Microbacterium resistens]|uniref:DUF1453 family protein n=1 Tax=Microbacterium resistens TaxID=156977 RepID=A0ABU1S993_9MICO|nr:hypothetical protein [Microbacterium resistens]MDR6866180.1 hypothetical protein [Microbacterium resistens]